MRGLGLRPLVYGVGERSSGAWLARVYHDKYAQEERLWQRHGRHGVGSCVYGLCRKFWQLTLNVSWLWSVLLAVAVLVASLAVYLVALMRGGR